MATMKKTRSLSLAKLQGSGEAATGRTSLTLPGLPSAHASAPSTPSTTASSSSPSSPLSSFEGSPLSRRSSASVSALGRAGANTLPQVQFPRRGSTGKVTRSTVGAGKPQAARGGGADRMRRTSTGTFASDQMRRASTEPQAALRAAEDIALASGAPLTEAAAAAQQEQLTAEASFRPRSAAGKALGERSILSASAGAVLGGPRISSSEACHEEADGTALLLETEAVAPRLLQFLRLRDIVVLHFASPSARSFCRSPRSHKLLVPTFIHNVRWVPYIDLPSIEGLYADEAPLISTRQNEEFAALLVASTSLQGLYCTHNPRLVAAGFSRALHGLSHLSVLDVSHNRLAVDDHSQFQRDQPLDLFFLALPPRLLVLDLSHNLLRDQHAVLLVESLEARCANGGGGLQELFLRSNLLQDTAGFAFRQLMLSPAGAELTRLDMRTNQVQAEGACAMLKALQVHPKLREMRVGYNRQNAKQDLLTAQMASKLLGKVLHSSSANQLEILDLNNVRVGNDGMRSIALSLAFNTTLKRMDLAWNSIGLVGAEALASALQSNQVLEQLDLRDNEVGDEGALALTVGLKVNYSLRRIQLARNGIGPRGALSLRSAVEKNTGLAVDFGASGDHCSTQLQGMLSRDPTMADLNFMRGAEREQDRGQQLTSFLFA